MPIADCYDSFPPRGNPRADWANWGGYRIPADDEDRLARETSMYRTLGDENPFAERLASDIQRVQQEDKMENTFKHEIKVVKLDNHYHVSVGCRETIVHDKKEALRWLGKLWDEHIKEE